MSASESESESEEQELLTDLIDNVVLRKYEEVVKILKENEEMDLNEWNEFGHLALVRLARTITPKEERIWEDGLDIKIAALLLDYGANINDKEIRGDFPLYVACEEGSEEMVEFFLKNDANPNQKRMSISCLMIADKQVYPEIFGILLKYGADPDEYNEGITVLHALVRHWGLNPTRLHHLEYIKKKKEILELLLGVNIRKYLVQIRAPDEPSLMSPDYLPMDIFKLITMLTIPVINPDLKTKVGYEKTALHEIVSSERMNLTRKYKFAKILLDNSADPNISDYRGNTPLLSAVLDEDGASIVELLLTERIVLDREKSKNLVWNLKITKADVNIKYMDGKTILDHALGMEDNEKNAMGLKEMENKEKIVFLLLDNEAEISEENRKYDFEHWKYITRHEKQKVKKSKMEIPVESKFIAFDLDKKIDPRQKIEIRRLQLPSKKEYYVLRNKNSGKLLCSHVHSDFKSLKTHLENVPSVLCPSCHRESKILASLK